MMVMGTENDNGDNDLDSGDIEVSGCIPVHCKNGRASSFNYGGGGVVTPLWSRPSI